MYCSKSLLGLAERQDSTISTAQNTAEHSKFIKSLGTNPPDSDKNPCRCEFFTLVIKNRGQGMHAVACGYILGLKDLWTPC